MEEILKELENLSDIEKINTLKDILEEKRKKIIYYVALKNLCFKNNEFDKCDETKNILKELKQQIEMLQKLKDSINLEKVSKKKTKKKKETKIEISLSLEEIGLLEKISLEDHEKILTNFDNIKVPFLEHLLNIKEKYIFYLKRENKKIKKLKKSISVLEDMGSSSSNDLNNQLDEKKNTKILLTKIIRYLDKLIKQEYKRINNINRKEKRLINTLFAEKYGLSEYVNCEEYSTEELYSTYYELVFKQKNIDYINDLLEKFPDLYCLKVNRKLFFENILDKYSNVLLNKNYVGKDKKALSNLEELEYYKKLILKYLLYSFENNDMFITEITINKIERVLYLLNNNEIYDEKSNIILEQIKYLKEVINLGSLSAIENSNIKEIQGQYIFSIDNENAKIKEDALSIRKQDNDYLISFYTPDIVSFVEPTSILDKKAFERFKNYRKGNYALPHDAVQFFRLLQGRKKRTIGYHFVIDMYGNLKDLKIEKNIIKLYNSYSFEEFDNLLSENEEKSAILLKELYCVLENKNDTCSSNILKSLILNLGIILGKYLNAKNIPCIYKNIEDGTIHSIPDKDYYVEFTSPLRSYISIMNQRILVTGHIEKNIEEKCIELNQNREEKQKCKRKETL